MPGCRTANHIIRNVPRSDATRGVLAQAVTEAMEEAKYPAAQPMPTLWGEEQIREWKLEEFLRTPAYAAGEDNRDWFRNRDEDHVAPISHWEILHPQLPIIRVTSYNTVRLPLTLSAEDFSYESITNPDPDRRDQLKKDAKHLRSRLSRGRVPSTTFGVSFVISFQNRWTSFEDPSRLMVRFPEEFEEITIIYGFKARTHWELHKERTPNYWHPSDYMQHRLIGPVVLQVYESEVLQPGIYSAVPKVTQWEAPEYVIPDSVFEDVREREKLGGFSEDALLVRWFLSDLPKPINYPLPGHIAVSDEMDERREYPAWRKLLSEIYETGRDW